MGEKTAFLTVMILFFLGVIPFLFYLYTQQVNVSKLMAVSTEINQLLIAEGDITERVNEVVEKFEENGFVITFQDENGNPISSRSEIGEKINIIYEYKGFKTMNSAYLTKRLE